MRSGRPVTCAFDSRRVRALYSRTVGGHIMGSLAAQDFPPTPDRLTSNLP